MYPTRRPFRRGMGNERPPCGGSLASMKHRLKLATIFKPLASAAILEPGDNWAPPALVDGKLLVRGQKQLKVLQVAQ